MDTCVFQSVRPEVDAKGWMRINLDSGAGYTVFPNEADYGDKSHAEVKINLKTATGEVVKSGDKYTVRCDEEYGTRMRIHGIQGPVWKPLCSAGHIGSKG